MDINNLDKFPQQEGHLTSNTKPFVILVMEYAPG